MPTLSARISNLWIHTRIHDTVGKYTFNIFKLLLLQRKMNISLHDEGWISTRMFKAEEWIASLDDERQDENSGKSVDRLYNMITIFDKKSITISIYLPNTTNISGMMEVFEKTCS
jgi:hypothetical protein